MCDLNRYARQMMLPEIGRSGQVLIQKARILVVGAGGLGCPVLQYLVGAGVGEITLFDPDVVDMSNLHRQPLFTAADIARPKAEAVRDHLLAVNPDLRLHTHIETLTPANAPDAVSQVDLVIDAADSFAVSYTLSDLCLVSQTPFISASVLGQSGYIGGFCAGVPSLRAVFPDPPNNGATCATAGVMGPVVGMIGAMQAQMALQVIIGQSPSPLGQLVSVDLQNLRFGGFDFGHAEEPAAHVPFVALSDIRANDHVIELRDLTEALTPAHVAAERRSAVDVLELTPSDRRLVLCCRSGLRAWRAASELMSNGHHCVAACAAGGA
ncbi:HesA/MoeB/ThiF family protein [Cochlodiniinecator piscidefendens]|uniref:HesA/MoeB/ThiF family protein n=1 Tax=Cochlodiniinecator piscidefendens TaxID=2715756 RepID=UPI00140CBD35|nr:HesA/MoeB/ThiF family protein [Cochlodiniinecator piscidefendens]